MLTINALQCEIFREGECLFEYVLRHTSDLENKILVVTSKIVSLAEGATAPGDSNKEDLIRSESDLYLGELSYGCRLTIKHDLLMISAGIDQSNSEHGDYILLPKNPFDSARRLHAQIKLRCSLKKFGILITDSRTSPLRPGVLGCGLACFGFRPIENRVGQVDLFGRGLKMTQINVIDAIAVSAVLMMGEANERMPLAVVSGAPVTFVDEVLESDLKIEISEDLYYPMYRHLISKQEKP